jgi:hypothetical protein
MSRLLALKRKELNRQGGDRLKINEIWAYFKKDQSNFRTKFSILLGSALAVFVLFIGSLFYISGQGSRLTITENEIGKEKEFISQYRREEQLYRDEFGTFAQPVRKNEIEKIQNDLIQKTKNYQLDVISLNNIASTVSVQNPAATANANANGDKTTKATVDGVEFEMGFVGTWEMSVKYIQELQKGSGLLSIRNFSMKPRPNTANLVETSLRYKIYLE